MPTDPNNEALADSQQLKCIKAQQEAIYKWYEARYEARRHTDVNVSDIYSAEWRDRLTKWHVWYTATHGLEHVHSESRKLRKAPEDLDLRSFFFEHPIAAFSLWHVLQAFYRFDEAVVIDGPSSEAQPTLERWQDLKPFEYLKSDEVLRKWKSALKKLDTDINYGDISEEQRMARMCDILDAVEDLETVLASLETDFKFDYADSKSAEWMLDTITDAFDRRCLMIARSLKKEERPPAYETIVSDLRRPHTFTDGIHSLALQDPLPRVHDPDIRFFTSVSELITSHAYDVAYVVFYIAVVMFSLYAFPRLQNFGGLSRDYE